MKIRLVLILALALSVNACSFIQEKPVDGYRFAEMQHLQQQRNWYFEGRLAMVDEKDSISASISWRHQAGRDDIELTGPLAQGRVAISVAEDKVVIDDGDNRKEYGGTVDDVVTNQLGMDMPVNALKYWVLGVNDPQESYVEQDGGFVQQGWLVRFGEMQRVKKEILPKKMTAEKDKTRIKLVVDQWDLS